MDSLRLAYGLQHLPFSMGSGDWTVLEPAPLREALDDGAIANALAAPEGTPPLHELAQGKSSALVIVSDPTRITRADLVLPHVLRELGDGGISAARTTVIIARGNHRAVEPLEIECMLSPELAANLDIRQHDSRDADSLRPVPPTSRGTKAGLNRLLWERDLVVVISAVTAHYFAGFGGGRKSVFPGLAERDGIIANHQLAIDFKRGRLADGVEPCNLTGNPVHEDFIEIVGNRPPDFIITSLMTDDFAIGALHCGHWQWSHESACERYMRHHGVAIPEKRAVVIASCGGAPKDIDLIQSHKTIQYATKALQPGGKLLLLAECPEGLGNKSFGNFFPIKDVNGLLRQIREENVPNGQTALALHQKTQEFDIGLVSALPDEFVKAMGMTPLESLEGGLKWTGADGGYIVPHGAMTLPYVHM